MQEKSSDIDVWEILENLTGKSDYAQTIEQLHYELAEQPPAQRRSWARGCFYAEKAQKKTLFQKNST